uniref:Uncharacterized protein n=1 Tax=Arundo donax TaxID=35708 RepID=A0A0A9A785_ARUDO
MIKTDIEKSQNNVAGNACAPACYASLGLAKLAQ